jgi:enamine deaminase RidA (YjgF/YER057c/UK114 family)
MLQAVIWTRSSESSSWLDSSDVTVEPPIPIHPFHSTSLPDEFTEQPQVINGCSDLMVEIFGEKGKHARSAVGTNALPLGVAVEIEAIIELEP